MTKKVLVCELIYVLWKNSHWAWHTHMFVTKTKVPKNMKADTESKYLYLIRSTQFPLDGITITIIFVVVVINDDCILSVVFESSHLCSLHRLRAMLICCYLIINKWLRQEDPKNLTLVFAYFPKVITIGLYPARYSRSCDSIREGRDWFLTPLYNFWVPFITMP